MRRLDAFLSMKRLCTLPDLDLQQPFQRTPEEHWTAVGVTLSNNIVIANMERPLIESFRDSREMVEMRSEVFELRSVQGSYAQKQQWARNAYKLLEKQGFSKEEDETAAAKKNDTAAAKKDDTAAAKKDDAAAAEQDEIARVVGIWYQYMETEEESETETERGRA